MKKRILFLQYTNPAGYPPLEHLGALLSGRGWEVTFLGTRPPGTETLNFSPCPGVRFHLLPWAARGVRQKMQYLLFCLWATGRALLRRPDWLYLSEPLACLPGLWISAVAKRGFVYHEHDLPPARPQRFGLRVSLWARQRLARRADLCVLPNLQRAQVFARQTGRGQDIFSIWNCPSREEAGPARPAEWHPPLRLVFQGSVGPGRLPLEVLQAMTELKGRVHLTVLGFETVGHEGYARRFCRRAEELGVAAMVDWRGAVPTRQEMLRLLREADVGLALLPMRTQDLNEAHMVGASNKPFEYLACGAALLVSDLPDWKELYVRGGCGWACDPSVPKSIAEALRWFLEHPERMRRMGEEGRRRVLADWNYESQAALVLDRLDG